MKYIIIGPIGAGKTTVSKMLAKKMKLDHVELDQFRRDYNKKKTDEGEVRARELFFRKISSKKSQVIELTGSGKIWQETMDVLKGREVFIIRLDGDEETLFRRIETRLKKKYKNPPFPKSWSFDSSPTSMRESIKWFKNNITKKHDFIINTDNTTPEEVTASLMRIV